MIPARIRVRSAPRVGVFDASTVSAGRVVSNFVQTGRCGLADPYPSGAPAAMILTPLTASSPRGLAYDVQSLPVPQRPFTVGDEGQCVVAPTDPSAARSSFWAS